MTDLDDHGKKSNTVPTKTSSGECPYQKLAPLILAAWHDSEIPKISYFLNKLLQFERAPKHAILH